jgi:hypothetical protein
VRHAHISSKAVLLSKVVPSINNDLRIAEPIFVHWSHTDTLRNGNIRGSSSGGQLHKGPFCSARFSCGSAVWGGDSGCSLFLFLIAFHSGDFSVNFLLQTPWKGIQSQSYFTTGGLPPISSSWRQAPWDSRHSNFIFQLNTWAYSPYVTFSLTRGWVCRLQLLLVLASAVILRSESRPCFTVSDLRLPQPGGQVSVFISPRKSVARLYLQTLGSISVASNDSQAMVEVKRFKMRASPFKSSSLQESLLRLRILSCTSFNMHGWWFRMYLHV